MTKPSDFSPSEALEVAQTGDSKESLRARWLLRIAGAAILVLGWLTVSAHHFGEVMFIADTIVFLTLAAYAFTAAAVSRANAVKEERKLRLRLLVHNMELENLSMRDELTQLFNRRYLFERLERELHTAKGFQRPLAFITIKIKGLDHVNHTLGYGEGDALLAAFGRFLMECTRATDVPARAGGNKFGIILPDTTKRGAYTAVERLVQSMASTSVFDEFLIDTSTLAEFGVSGYPWGSDSLDGIVRQAEEEATPAELRLPPSAGSDDPQAGEIPAVFRKLDEAARGP